MTFLIRVIKPSLANAVLLKKQNWSHFTEHLIPMQQRLMCSKGIPKNVIGDNLTGSLQTENGAIYDKKPFKLHLKEGKTYSWCLCGKSKSQPICDGTHKNVFLKINLRPVRFKVEKTGDYWLCNCKHTKHRPFCDGTHKQAHIQAAVK